MESHSVSSFPLISEEEAKDTKKALSCPAAVDCRLDRPGCFRAEFGL